MKINFKTYKIKLPKNPKPSNRHYKRMVRKIRKDLPRLNG